jgi:hypothetical protein
LRDSRVPDDDFGIDATETTSRAMNEKIRDQAVLYRSTRDAHGSKAGSFPAYEQVRAASLFVARYAWLCPVKQTASKSQSPSTRRLNDYAEIVMIDA